MRCASWVLTGLFLAGCGAAGVEPPGPIPAVPDRDGDGYASEVDCDDGDPTVNAATFWWLDEDGDRPAE